MDLTFLTKLVDASKLAGWVRAGVGALFVMVIAKWPILSGYVDPALQTEIAALLATVAVGYWSQLTKTDEAKVKAVSDLALDPASPVKGVITENSPAGIAMAAKIDGPVVKAGSAAATSIAKA